MKSSPRRLRELLAQDIPEIAPLALDPISAKLAEDAGFKVLYLGGGSMGYAKVKTEANLTLTEMVHHGLDIRAACSLPLILDGTCGWGDPMHLHHTIAMSEAAGFAAIEIEDQILPRRAHHHIGLEHLVPQELMVQKIQEAVSARRDPDFVIVARTNACRQTNLDDALRRAEAYRKAGADLLLVLPKTPEQAREIAEKVGGPLYYMMISGPQNMGMSLEELGKLGYKIVIEPAMALLAAHKAIRMAYEALRKGQADPLVGEAAAEEGKLIHKTIGLDKLLDAEIRTVEK